MTFVSFEFAALLAVVLVLYASLQRRAQNVVLLIASYVFYGAWSWKFLFLLAGSTLWDYFIAKRIHASLSSPDPRAKKRWLLTSLCASLGLLGFFKYYNFFTHEAVDALANLGVVVHPLLLNVVLPVGISFYTFQSISYVVDIYRGELEPANSLLDFATFIAFFPQLVAGPIERAKHMLPQFQSVRRVSVTDFREGSWLMLIGYVRKVAIADTAAHFATPMFDDPSKYSSLALVAGLLLFSLQIYGDFAGYTDIARGTARLFGFRLMRNFEHPYFSKNVSEFWRRWHISLSTWLRDYLYVSLGGNRRGQLRTYANLMITMLLGGLWHGASWNFIIWGGLHGLYLCAHRAARAPLDAIARATGPRLAPVRHALAMLVTFALATFTWLFFRSTSKAITLAYLAGLGRGTWTGATVLAPVLVLTTLTLLIDLPQALSGDELRLSRFGRAVRLPLAAAMIVLLLMSHDTGQPFIYFQF